MCHSYEVIKLLSKLLTQKCGVFIPVFIGKKSYKKSTKNATVIVENKVAPVNHSICSLFTQTQLTVSLVSDRIFFL